MSPECTRNPSVWHLGRENDSGLERCSIRECPPYTLTDGLKKKLRFAILMLFVFCSGLCVFKVAISKTLELQNRAFAVLFQEAWKAIILFCPSAF